MEKGTVYFFTGLAGAGKTTIGGLFYQKLKELKPDAVLFDGDQLRVFGGDHDYSTEARRRGAKTVFARCKELADQGVDSVYCGIGMYEDVRRWNRENIENYREVYIKVSMETLRRRNQKGLYSPGVKQVVGVDLPWDEPQTSDVVIENDREDSPEKIVEDLVEKFLSVPQTMKFYFEEHHLWSQTKSDVFKQINEMGLPLVLIGRSSATDPSFLAQIKVPIEYVCSNTPSTWGSEWWGKTVISPIELPGKFDKYNALIVVSMFRETLSTQLCALATPPEKIFCLDMYFEKPDSVDYLKSQAKDMETIYEILGDQFSRDTYEALIHYRVNRNQKLLDQFTLPFNEQYFPESFGGIPFLNDKEIFVDIGAYTGDTVQEFVATVKGNYKHIYAFEPDERSFCLLKDNTKDISDISLIQKGVGNQITQAGISSKGTASVIGTGGDYQIQIDTLDHALAGIPVTYIKMDIEGMESNAIRGAANIIRTYKPKLAVCIYHSDRDMVNLPKLILNLNPDYKLYIRHYTNCLLETVCYAI